MLASDEVKAACVPSGTTVTCTGDLTSELPIAFESPAVEILNVNSLTKDIMPGGGDAGVSLIGQGGEGQSHGSDPVKGKDGGSGGTGHSVEIDYVGGVQVISTTGDSAQGIIGKSAGGKGGNGGEGIGALGVPGVGGTGGAGGESEGVTIDASGNISTADSYGHGILAVSQGGDGGEGGFGSGAAIAEGFGGDGGHGGSAGIASVTNGGDIETAGTGAQGIFVQSLGGAGGAGGGANGISASAGSAGDSRVGSTVHVDNSGSITTGGSDAYGILAQSVGGFGGTGGGGSGIFAFGGGGSPGADGGAVTVDNSGPITTTGQTGYGILAQSVGGDGGKADSSGGLVTVGGSGAGGGSGAHVTLTNTGVVNTGSTVSLGILAQSVGGGGGDAGSSGGLVTIGGSGDTGGNGGSVTGSNSGEITTAEKGSIGLLVQSVGGGGGHGGGSGALIAIGGSGGGGGAGNKVTFTNTGNVATSGDQADAIFVQSQGGGGGHGGAALGLGGGLSIAVGGSAGGGNAGGDVDFNPNTDASSAPVTISTAGDQSVGVGVLSVGGGGGKGGWAISASAGPYDVSVGVGGRGGSGGVGGNVAANINGTIGTAGNSSGGLIASSHGGGGGHGGFTVDVAGGQTGSISVGVGGSGGSGGDGGTVDLKSWAATTTGGDHSPGITAQSHGGGGGHGGFSVSVAAAGVAALGVSIGGKGGVGGNASTVDVASTGNIQTGGVQSYGLLAQSLGGGGGNGGFSVGVAGSAALSSSVSVGGAGEAGGNGGAVTASSDGTIVTTGDHADGLLAQSLGGSGGNGGFSVSASVSMAATIPVSVGGSADNGGTGDSITVGNNGDITTSGSSANALHAQSLGGGGGSGGFSVAGGISIDPDPEGGSTANITVSVGGKGGNGNSASTVMVDNTGDLTTSGAGAVGLLATSQGGGGGNGGFSVAGSIAVSADGGANINVTVGGGGGTGNVGSDVTVNTNGNVQTAGDNATGIFAQSVGGSGGRGGFSVSGEISGGSEGYNIGVSVGGGGGSGNNAATVSLDSDGNVGTAGENSAAILAQSVGGGGGHGGFSVTAGIVAGSEGGNIGVGVGGSGSGGGDGGNVKVGQIDPNTGDVIGPITGNLTTTGNNSPGIQAQSIGGGGGSGGFSGTFGAGPQSEISVSVGGSGGSSGDGKDVTVNSGGNVSTAGKTSYGIQAQSVARGGGNGGFSIAGDLTISNADSTNADVSVSVGGSGGSGGTSGNVMLTNSGAVSTTGDGGHALFGQSVGGGGGNGGFSGSVNLAFQGDVNIGVSVGGGAGDGGTAGDVTVASTSATAITTLGDGASGIFAQSLGGKGGDGGFSFTANVGVGNSENGQDVNIGVSVGGGGGGGGTAGTVNVTNFSDISIGALETDTILGKTVITGISGTSGSGIFAQSVGGNGGNGGLSVSGALDLSTTNPSNNLNVSVGGAGGSGNNASTVSVENHGDIATLGGKSNAIFAQSVGGDGGNGGLSFAGSLAGGAGSKDINVSIGGSGGGGGHGATVTVVNTGALTTGTEFEFEPNGGITADIDEPVLLKGSPIPGYQAQAIFAQSVGGGGGTGGLAGSAVLSNSGDGTNLNVNVSVGGSGGEASNGGLVDVTNSGAITTYAVSSIGIVAQSVGGGGGDGGSSFTGIVGVNKTSNPNPEPRKLNINVAVGGKGGAGGDGGSVEVHNMVGGDITTFGGSAKGIAAQSIGGGGGSGGDADAFSLQIGKCTNPLIPSCTFPDEAEKELNLDVAVGGSGGAGGNASSVMVENFGIIQTAGASSEAIYAQSIGGGGGQGGNGALGLHDLIGIPGAVIDDLVDIVQPPFQFWSEVGVNVGGAGGTAGNGGEVTIANNSALVTTGDQSSAIYVQSGGGGGGQGGKSNGGALQIASVHVGGASGAAGDGSTVEVTNTGDIGTTGVSSIGIFAQSYGGGGGDGGAVNPDFLGTGWAFGLGIDISQGGGHGGNGGEVTVTNSAFVVTEGEGAHGIWAQSVGGGGGLAGASGISLVSYAGSNGDEGDGKNVLVTHTGDILTLGDGAAGIFAQSASGGADGSSGGVGDDYALRATGDGGTVTVNVNSTIITEGEKSRGIVAQSIGKNGNGDITVTIGTGSVVIGGTDMDGFGVDDDPVGIQLLDGKTNLIEIADLGLVTTREGISGTAISTSRTSNAMTTSNNTKIDNTLNNAGIVTGSMFFAEPQFGGSNAVNNEITGLLNMGVTIDLGGGMNTLTNKGVVSPGGVNNILTTAVNGDFVQDGLGSYVVTVDYADNNPAPEMYDGPGTNESDLINVSGGATLEGFVIVDAINGAFVGPDQSGKVLILESIEEIGTAALIAPDTEVVTYDITYERNNGTDPDKVFLDWIVDFTPDGLNRNETAVANYIIEAIDVGDPLAISPVINSLLEAETLDDLRNDYDRLTPEPYIDNEIATVLSNMRLGRSLMDCPRPDLEEYVDHKGCLWLRGGAMQTEQSETFEYLGYDEFAYEAQAGLGGNLSDTVGAVLGFSYSNSQIDTKGRFGTPDIASSTGQRYQGGVGLSRTVNGSTFAIAALGGAAFYDVERNLELTDFSATAKGEQNIYFGGGQIRLAHEAKAGVFRFAPLFEAWGGYFYQEDISESGAGGSSLDIESKDDYFLAVRPALTLALEFTSDDGGVFQPFITGGATYFAVGNEGDGPSLTATMQGEENMVPGFTVSSALQEYYVDAAAGFMMKAATGAALRLSGQAQYAEEYLSYGGDAKFVMPF